jgi:AraC-like DNA-binding protein
VQAPEERVLPRYAAGELDVPFVIAGWDELVERDTVWPDHSHPTHELLWNERGASTTTVGSRTWTVTPSLGLWIPAGTVHAAAATAGTWYRAAQFGTESVAPLAEQPVAVVITPLLRLLLERLRDPALTASSRAVTEAAVLDVLAPAPRELLVRMPESAVLEPIVRALRAHPGDPRGLGEWAAELGISTRTITRALQAETGLGFARWQSSLRASHAAALLLRGDRLEDVADDCGFATVSAFSAAFRRATGVTPGSFRAAS